MELAIPVERTLTQTDYVRLTRLVQLQPRHTASAAIQDLLEVSDLVATPALPHDVVSMDARVLLQDPRGDAPAYELTVCFPEDADPARAHVSVLSPVGSSLLGLRAGETARWRMPDGREGAARILAVLSQPESGESVGEEGN